jgi:uncharacterized protein with PhoU and TrkA domain
MPVSFGESRYDILRESVKTQLAVARKMLDEAESLQPLIESSGSADSERLIRLRDTLVRLARELGTNADRTSIAFTKFITVGTATST